MTMGDILQQETNREGSPLAMNLTGGGRVGCFGASRITLNVTISEDATIELLQLRQGILVALSILNASPDQRTLMLTASGPDGAPYEVRNTWVTGSSFPVPGSDHSKPHRYVGTAVGNALQMAWIRDER